MVQQLLFLLFFNAVQPPHAALAQNFPSEVVVGPIEEYREEYGKDGPSLDMRNAPQKKGDSIAPVISAASVYALDISSGTPLFVRDIFTRRPIASIEKLVTAMVILDHHKLDEKVIVSKTAASQEGSRMWLVAGEEMTVENLLKGMLINSGNDAAVTLAEYDASTESAFVDKMNEKVLSLKLYNTHFSNAKGFYDPDNYSAAFDTMVFARAALEYPALRKIVMIKKSEVSSADGKLTHKLESTNELLENPYWDVVGLKTGRTPAAGESFVSLLKGPNEQEILTVMLDSPDRFKETKILLDWILRNFEFPF